MNYEEILTMLVDVAIERSGLKKVLRTAFRPLAQSLEGPINKLEKIINEIMEE